MVNNWLVRGFMIIKGFNMNERHLWAAARFEPSAGFGRGRLHHIGRCLQPLPVWGKDDLSVVATLEYQCFMVNTLELGGGGDVLYSYQQQVDTGVGEGGDGKLHGGGRGVERGTGGRCCALPAAAAVSGSEDRTVRVWGVVSKSLKVIEINTSKFEMKLTGFKLKTKTNENSHKNSNIISIDWFTHFFANQFAPQLFGNFFFCSVTSLLTSLLYKIIIITKIFVLILIIYIRVCVDIYIDTLSGKDQYYWGHF